MKAYINGIPFQLQDPEESGEWNVQCYEYISDHPPTTKRMSKKPTRYSVSGLFVGKLALLQKKRKVFGPNSVISMSFAPT